MKNKTHLAVVGLTSLVALGGAATFAQSTSSTLANKTKTTINRTFDIDDSKDDGYMEKGWDKGLMSDKELMGPGKMKMPGMKLNSGARAAITANNYTAFVTAIKGTKLEGKIDQAQFDRMVAGFTRSQARLAAVSANDYAAFIKAVTPTQAEFTEIVANYTKQQGIEAALKANDYNAYLVAIKGTPQEGKVTQAEFNARATRFAKK